MFIILFIYAPAHEKDKDEFWDSLFSYARGLVEPFIIMGDFNELSSVADKMGGAMFKFARLNRFNFILANTNCIELDSFGQPFTW